MNAATQLLELLERNAALYEDLARNCDLEQAAVKQCDLPRLGELVKEKENLALKLKMMDEARGALLGRIAQEMRRDSAALTLADVAARPQAWTVKGRLLAAGERLKKAADAARDKSDFSRRLISRALDNVVGALRGANALAGGNAATYSNAKTLASAVRSGMMVARSY